MADESPEQLPIYSKTYVKMRHVVRMEIAYSEVAIHMNVAGKEMLAAPISNRMAQLFREDRSLFSFPIKLGEAGFLQDEGGIYYLQRIRG